MGDGIRPRNVLGELPSQRRPVSLANEPLRNDLVHRRSSPDKREKTFVVAYIVTQTARHRCHILNVSLSGALVVVTGLKDAPDRFEIDFADRFYPATRVWQERGRWGIVFQNKLTQEQLAAWL